MKTTTLILILTGLSLMLMFLLKIFRKKKIVKDFSSTLAQIDAANGRFNKLINYSKYFANYDQNQYITLYKPLYKEVKDDKSYIHLPAANKELIETFKTHYSTIEKIRKVYNKEFIVKEKSQFKYLFDHLEANPLSDDQRTAIVTDEDNNLVIAGAGTGKTTTIGGKVAYLIEKGLAKPEQVLVISFTTNAVEEMRDRIKEYLNNDDVTRKITIKTFNSYGFEVVRTMNLEKDFRIAFENEDKLLTFLQTQFDHLFLRDNDYCKKAINFLAFFSRPNRDEFEFETGDEYHKHEKSFKNIGFDGISYKSKEEVEIANFLFLNSITYEYEKVYTLKIEDKNPAYGTYQPDFYLSDYDIYLEHFGIDEQGNVPKFFSSSGAINAKEKYNNSIAWKRQIHEKYQTKLVETYSFENRNNTLLKNLKQKLIDLGVEMIEKKPEQILAIVKEQDVYADFNKLLATFLSLMKSNKYEPDDVAQRSRELRLKVFLAVFKPIYKIYQQKLAAQSLLDFNDMINVAADGIANQYFKHPFKYILIDEFQDMSLNRYELLKAMKQQNPAVKIYAVGDDWQSIYRFSGSDISLLTAFKKYFGYSAYTKILNTYRFNSEILEKTSSFIQSNDAQLKKELVALTTPKEPSFRFIGIVGANAGREERQDLTRKQVTAILQDLNKDCIINNNRLDVYLIGRYKFNKPSIDYKGFSHLKIEFKTAHGAKGSTCDVAVLLDVNAGVMGFPSEIADDPILEYLLHEGDRFENAEERRLFYVATTRARHKNYIIYNTLNESKFVKELKELCDHEEINGDYQKCPSCKALMVKRTTSKGAFWGCSNYPSCKGTLRIRNTHPLLL